jgi:hypothetical protein
MKLTLLRVSSQIDSTSGILFDSTEYPKFLCYTLEDEFRSVKVASETRIPEGTYKIGLRTEGGFHARYSSRFNTIHKGMLELQDVPNFKWILIHCGNTDENTAGCILVGNSQTSNLVQKDGFIGSSTDAYKTIYPSLATAAAKGELEINIVDFDSKGTKVKTSTSNKTQDHLMLTDLVDKKFDTILKELKNLKQAVKLNKRAV